MKMGFSYSFEDDFVRGFRSQVAYLRDTCNYDFEEDMARPRPWCKPWQRPAPVYMGSWWQPTKSAYEMGQAWAWLCQPDLYRLAHPENDNDPA